MQVELIDEEAINVDTNDSWYELPYQEKDPLFKESPAYNISEADILNWNNKVTDEEYVHTDNNYTLEEKTKLAGLYNYDDTDIKEDISDLDAKIPANTSDLENDGSGFAEHERYAITMHTDNNSAESAGNGIYIDYLVDDDYCTVKPIFDYNVLDDFQLAFQSDIPKKTSDLRNDSNYVSNTDYAETQNGGVIKVHSNYGTSIGAGWLQAQIKSYTDYTNMRNDGFISKGTLENVLNVRIGDISSALDLLNGEVI